VIMINELNLSQSKVIILIISLIILPSVLSLHPQHYPFKSNFKTCCSIGKQTPLDKCDDYSTVPDNSTGCKFAFNVCCNQNQRQLECEEGKKIAYDGKSCNTTLNTTTNSDQCTTSMVSKILDSNGKKKTKNYFKN
jgi:hypothetical protein